MSRFFFVVGHVALKLLVYTESLTGAVRNANAARTLAKQEEAAAGGALLRTGADSDASSPSAVAPSIFVGESLAAEVVMHHDEDEEIEDIMEWPEGNGAFAVVCHLLLLPVKASLHYTIPDVRKEGNKKKYAMPCPNKKVSEWDYLQWKCVRLWLDLTSPSWTDPFPHFFSSRAENFNVELAD